MSLSTGARLGPYEILAPLGHGGMGEVYRARHLKLEREVAIKVLPDEVACDRARHARFEREARLASSLNHPNIVTIYDVAEHEGTSYIAMEFVEGRTLRKIIGAESIPIERMLDIGAQMADGLAKAHAAGVVHRDFKPENVMLTADGIVKILDFGLAKEVVASETLDTAASTQVNPSVAGTIVGTPRYMSPEQISGRVLDHRSDQFAYGIVLYEMIAGRPPFDGPSVPSIITAISHDPPPPLAPLRRDVPRDLERLVDRCLEKDPDARYTSTADVALALRAIRERRARPSAPAFNRRTIAIAAAIVLAVSGLGVWFWFHGAERRWAEHEAIPQISALIDKGSVFEAYRLAFRAKRATPDAPELEKLLGRISLPAKFVTDPPGATVSMKGYDTPDAPWEPLGTTPLETRIPYALMRVQIQKDGFETYEGAPFGGGASSRVLKLDPKGSWPPGMVRVWAHNFDGQPQNLRLPGDAPAVPIDAFFIDRTEVTNRDFKRFVDGGGYRERKYWTDGFPDDASQNSWSEVIQSFKDSTGRPAPATWSVGTFPEGTGDFPVGGVSWYEAAAYCRFAGKSLPTIYHWSSAVQQRQFSDILRLSNFDSKGPAPVGKYQGLAGYGTVDMAGNVNEWCFNATPEGKRHLLGGSWSDPGYVFGTPMARSPLERLPTDGFRCASLSAPPRAELLAAADSFLGPLKMPRISEEVFEAYRGMYTYDPAPLNSRLETTDDSSPHWKKEVVSFDAAYDSDRVMALLFLPRNARPPYQAVIWMPGADAYAFRSTETLASSYLFDFIPQSGRALVYVVYDGIYERSKQSAPSGDSETRSDRRLPGAPAIKHGVDSVTALKSETPLEQRDRVIRWSKDFSRTVDYLETRKDFDTTRLAYYGLSNTATLGPIFVKVDGRIRTEILLGGGLLGRAQRQESAPVHFVDRCSVPTLIINGNNDFLLPIAAQKLLLERLATPPQDKRLAILAGGHIPSSRIEIIREVLDWLDKYLGPVETTVASR